MAWQDEVRTGTPASPTTCGIQNLRESVCSRRIAVACVSAARFPGVLPASRCAAVSAIAEGVYGWGSTSATTCGSNADLAPASILTDG